MNSRVSIPVAHREGVAHDFPPRSLAPPRSYRFIADDNGITGVLVEEVDGVRHARAARFFWRGGR